MQFNDNQPIWLQIYDHACRAIVSGRWPERERIPLSLIHISEPTRH